MEAIGNKVPTVFISYSWDNEEHKSWVLGLANSLGQDGIDVFLDRYELRLGSNLTVFIENAIKNSNRILILFTPNYKLKADNREGGVGYEYSIINIGQYKNIVGEKKIIPILRSGNKTASIPEFMQQYIHLDISDDRNFEDAYQQLLREIYDEPEIIKPILGKKPEFKQAAINTVTQEGNSLKSNQVNQNIIKVPSILLNLSEKLNELKQIATKTPSQLRAQSFLYDELNTEKINWAKSELNKYIPENIFDLQRRIDEIKNEKNQVVKKQRFAEAASLRDSEKRLFAELNTIVSIWIEDFSCNYKSQGIFDIEERLENLQNEKRNFVKKQQFDEIISTFEIEEKLKYELDLAKNKWKEILLSLFFENPQPQRQEVPNRKETASHNSNFSTITKEVISYSREEALKLGNDFIGTEHLLLGLLRKDDCLVSQTLLRMHIDIFELRKKVEAAVKDKNSKPLAIINSLPLTLQAEKVIRISVLEAKSFQSQIVETNHLMLSILANKDTLASQILFLYDVDYNSYKNSMIL